MVSDEMSTAGDEQSVLSDGTSTAGGEQAEEGDERPAPADERGRPPAPEVAAWLTAALDDPGPFTLTSIGGGNSNETLLLESPTARRVLRHPPPASLSPGAHSMGREHQVLTAIAGRGVPAPRPLAFAGEEVPGGPWLAMELVDGVALTEELPPAYPPGADSVAAVGAAAIDALAALHRVDWRAAGLDDFGRPEGFLERQVGRWRAHFERHQVRELPDFERVAAWLEANPPAAQAPALIHGDFHLDNCLFSLRPPAEVTAIIDWEMSTIGDPLLDLGLLLAFWGNERPSRPAMPWVQALTRVPGAPARGELADRYAAATDRSVDGLPWYMALAFWKLAAIVEGAYAQHLAGELDSDYARGLAADVPALLAEAAAFAGLPSA
jgi:aminoglycoside phosphotransferase (APT) family kinase protein